MARWPRSMASAFAVIVSVTTAAVLLIPLCGSGLPNAADAALHVGNTVESAFLLNSGVFPWSWLPDVAGGYGGPNYLYYGSLGFVVPAGLTTAGLEPVLSLKVSVALGFVVAFVAAWRLARFVGGPSAGVFGALLYVWNPYFLGLAYTRASYPEFFAASLYPVAVLACLRWTVRGHGRWFLLGCFAYAAVVAIHTLSLILLTPFLLLLCASSAGANRARFLRAVAPVALGVLVAAPYLVGPLFQRGLISIEQDFSRPSDYAELGIPWYAILNTRPATDEIVARIFPGRIHIALWICASFGPWIGLVPWRAGTRRRLGIAGAVLAGGALFLCLPPVFRAVVALAPQVAYVQFPWRFLGVFSLGATVAISVVYGRIPLVWMRACLLLLVSVMTPLWYWPVILPQEARYAAYQTREGLRSTLTTLDHEDKYLPATARKPISPRTLPYPRIVGAERAFAPRSCSGNDYWFDVELTQPETVVFEQYAFPGWTIEADRRTAIVVAGRELGLCSFSLSAGRQAVHVYYRQPWWRRVANGVAVGASAAALAWVVWRAHRRANVVARTLLPTAKMRTDRTAEVE